MFLALQDSFQRRFIVIKRRAQLVGVALDDFVGSRLQGNFPGFLVSEQAHPRQLRLQFALQPSQVTPKIVLARPVAGVVDETCDRRTAFYSIHPIFGNQVFGESLVAESEVCFLARWSVDFPSFEGGLFMTSGPASSKSLTAGRLRFRMATCNAA